MKNKEIIKLLHNQQLFFKPSNKGWKQESLDYIPESGAQEELKFMLEMKDFQPDSYCISILAMKLIDDECKKDPEFDANSALNYTTQKLHKYFESSKYQQYDFLHKLSPGERSIFYALTYLKEDFFNEDCMKRNLNAKLGELLINGCLISSDYQAVKFNEQNLEKLQKDVNEIQKEKEQQAHESDGIAALICGLGAAVKTAVEYSVKNTVNHLKLAV